MKTFDLSSRLFLMVSMLLTVCHPGIQASAAQTLPVKETSHSPLVAGSLENGLSFTLIPSKDQKEGTWIKLGTKTSNEKEDESLSLLTQHSLFYGTKKFNRAELISKLAGFGLDVDPESNLQSNESEQSFQFSLSTRSPESVEEFLSILNQMAFFPAWDQEGVEVARNHLLSTLDESEELLPYQCITGTELQKFHSSHYKPENMLLTVVGFDNQEEFISILASAFDSPVKNIEKLDLKSVNGDDQIDSTFASSFLQRVELASDNQSWVVDGKIWMKEPNWINKSSNGKSLGAWLTVLGIGGGIGLALAFPVAVPAAIIAGSLSTFTGVYFLSSDYLKDPNYIESVRATDLKNGCAYAYKKGRAGLTLTPYERRSLFLKEMIDHPQTLPKLPILLIADLYQLNDPVIAEIFTVDEFNVLTRLKRDFIQQRNQYKILKASLENELASIAAPYTLSRDAGLLYAKDVYNQNYYVLTKSSLKAQRDASVSEIKQTYNDNEITLDERDDMIEQAQAYYEAYISDPEFKAGLDSAESTLTQMELEVQATYAYNLEQCKQSILYNIRMEQLKYGENSVVQYFNVELHNLLSNYPVYLTILHDYLDLRSL